MRGMSVERSDRAGPAGAAGRAAATRAWAWVALAAIPVWLVLAGALLAADRRAPELVEAAPGSSRIAVGDQFRRSTVKDLSLYVAPATAAGGAGCVSPKAGRAAEAIDRTRPDRAGTATRVHQGVTYAHYGRVYSLTEQIECAAPVSGLLLTEYDGDHQARWFAVLLLLSIPVLALVALWILRRPHPRPRFDPQPRHGAGP